MKSKAKNNSVLQKILSALLCLCMLSSLFQAQILGASALTAPDVHITKDGKKISSLVLPQTDKAVLSAEVSSQSGSPEFQWQLLSDISSDEWINIYDATSQTLNLSYLTVESLLDNAGSVYLRACAQNGEVKGYSEPVSVTVQYNVPADETSFLSPTLQTVTNAKAAAASSEYVNIAINYLDALSGQSIYSSYTAQIQRGTSYTNSVISPTYLGYAAYYNKSKLNITVPDEGEVDTPDDATIIKLDIPESYSGDNYVINVYYKPIDVPYAAKYFFQNVNDDFYSEDYSLYKKSYAKTGTIISNSDLEVKNPEKIKGFTKLYHYPESVAADGSTVFECYYDRNYYFIKFDMDGGYGLDPIYARYDTPFVAKNPTKSGYTFEGWDLLENGVGDGVADVMPTNIPNENRTYKALWKAVNSKYTTVYWLQNPDDDNYSYQYQITRYADADTVVSGSDDLTETTLICDNNDENHTHTDVCYPENFDRIEFEKADQNVVVKGDGSTIVNVYYTRKYYTLRFIYAKEYNGIYDYYAASQTFSGIRYFVIGGSTYGFGNPKKSWPNNKYGQDYTLEELLYNLPVVESGEQWGCIYETYDQVEDKSKLPQIIEPDIKNAKYSTGVYPEPGTGYQQNGKGNGNYTIRGDRFYYFDLTARYGADLTKLWPSSVFDKIKVAHPDKHVDNGGVNNLENDGWGNYAYLAGWNSEFKVTYSIENTNTTIKGLYQKLDDNLLFGALSGQDKFTYGDDRTITTTATVDGKTVTSYVNYYINFFNNGLGVRWNIPREWNYNLFVPVFDDELSDDQITTIKQYGSNAKTYDIDGNTYYYYKNNDVVYRLYNHIVTSDNNTTANHQTQPALSGFKLESGSLSDYCRRAEKISNGKLSDGRQSYTLRFFYKRDTFGFIMHNHSSIYYSNLKAEFDSDLDQHVYKNGKQVVPDYPQTLEPGAYEFKGWYTTIECYNGSEYTKGTKMPANNLALYAKWAPKPHTVRFFKNYEAMLKYQQDGDESGLIEEKIVLHGNVVGDINNPIDSENGYSFSGWFFTKTDNMVGFNPTDTAINGDMNIFADWGSQSSQPYILNYVLDKPETDSAIIALLNKASEGTPQDNKRYTITDDGTKKTYVYLEADGKYHLSIADSSTGYAYQGNTRTFYPKVGDP